MLVAICQIELMIFDSHSLKDKRSVIKSLKDRISQKFNISIAEVAEHDNQRKCTFGIAIVSNEKRHLEKTYTNILNLIGQNQRVEIINQVFELG
ncbi:MAG: DUF503 domain-containing protein [Calditrichaeota bacterium]|nr:MAG: DUF503 domain-containing protein [Calditrichota bacterium]